MEGLRVAAVQASEGYEFETYDAEWLFREGLRRMRAEDCALAVQLYDRVFVEFPDSRYASAAIYNAGLCFRTLGVISESVERFETLLANMPTSEDRKHAAFMLAELYLRQERWDEAMGRALTLLSRGDLSPDERVEALSRQAQALLGAERIEEAGETARNALRYVRRQEDQEPVQGQYFPAAANYVLAETLRLQAEAIDVPEASLETQRDRLESRAQLILNAQREYFNTMRYHQPEWSAVAGYRVGGMYDSLWDAIMTAPVPDPPDMRLEGEDLALYQGTYRERLKALVKPLLRHSIRYWELTLLMIERTGVESEWTERIRGDLNRVRSLLAEQPGESSGESPATQPREAHETEPTTGEDNQVTTPVPAAE